jgi:hypothetical protein
MAPLIKVYSEIISANGYQVHVLLPKFADRVFFDSIIGVKKYKLPSSIYTPALRESFFVFLFYRLLGKRWASVTTDSLIKRSVRKILILKTVIYLFKTSKLTRERILLLLPTADPLSIELIKTITKFHFARKFYIRIRMVGSESRGILGHETIYEDLIQVQNTNKMDLKIGVETQGYEDFLIKKGIDAECLSWSPWPTFNIEKLIHKHESSNISIGFLGGAKKRKGFDLIPLIINYLISSGGNYKFFIQKSVHPWMEYHKTLSKLDKEFKNCCEFLPANINLEKLLEILPTLDCVILPYDPESYKINASGILYHAADAGIPVVTFCGVGFEQEINEFQIGIIIDDLAFIKNSILHALKISSTKFEIYNKSRNNANKSFLFTK